MQRLTETAKITALNNFKTCQLCGFKSDEITDFWLWYECEENDKVDTTCIICTCRSEACQKVIEDHPRLYYRVPWGNGKAGHFNLICGDCPFRKGATCSHPNLKENGGKGLLLNYRHPFGGPVHIICSDGRSGYLPIVFSACEGRGHKNMTPINE